jgi:uncharacterized membrane protein YeaQ/YmgE (transglycosylase-associated protein family)
VEVFEIIWIVVVGLAVGLLAKAIVPGRQNIPWWLTILLGVAGALIGNGIAGWIAVRHTTGVDWIRHALQLAIAVVLVAVVSPTWTRSQPRR